MALNRVDINVTIDDVDGDPVTVGMLGSLTGAFGGEEFTLTAVPGDGAHTFASPVSGGALGVAQNFVWDISADLAPTFSGTVYLRMTLDDGTNPVVNVDTSTTVTVNQSPSVTVDSIVKRGGSALTDIGFTVEDPETDNVTYVLEGSTTGAFGGEEFALTLVPGDGAHDAVNPLATTTPTGTAYNAVWDAQANLPLGFSNTVYIRATVTDVAANTAQATNNATIDLNDPPFAQITGVVQRAGDYALVDVPFDAADPESDNIDFVIEGSLTGMFTGEEFALTAVPGDGLHDGVSPVATTPGGLSYNYVWDPTGDVPAGQTNVYLRIRYDDNVNPEVFTMFGGNPVAIKNNAAPQVSGLTASVRYV